MGKNIHVHNLKILMPGITCSVSSNQIVDFILSFDQKLLLKQTFDFGNSSSNLFNVSLSDSCIPSLDLGYMELVISIYYDFKNNSHRLLKSAEFFETNFYTLSDEVCLKFKLSAIKFNLNSKSFEFYPSSEEFVPFLHVELFTPKKKLDTSIEIDLLYLKYHLTSKKVDLKFNTNSYMNVNLCDLMLLTFKLKKLYLHWINKFDAGVFLLKRQSNVDFKIRLELPQFQLSFIEDETKMIRSNRKPFRSPFKELFFRDRKGF